MRRSSHKAMGKRIFFLLSKHHHMQKLLPPSYENVLLLNKKASLVSQYRLPSFRDGFSDWVQDTRQMNAMQSELAQDRVYNWLENVEMQLPGISTLLEWEWD